MGSRSFLDTNSREYSNFLYRELIPKKYRKWAGVKDHNFDIIDPSGPYHYVLSSQDKWTEIPVSMYCKIHKDDSPVHVLVDQEKSQELFESLLLFSRLYRRGAAHRITKYMTLYKAFEIIAHTGVREYSAIRHALSHHGPMLSRPSTVETLRQLFGNTRVDLDLYQHEKMFYIYFGRMLVDTDKIIKGHIVDNFDQWDTVKGKKGGCILAGS